MRMITDYCNLRTFLIIKNLTCHKAGWWEQLSGLDMEIEYCSGKKNSANGLSWHPDAANNKNKKTLYTVGYMTQGLIKCGETQKTIENTYQATQQPEVTSEANNKLESHFTNNESLPYDTIDDRTETSSAKGSNMPNSNPIKTRKISSKRKRKKSIKQAKKVLLRGKKKKKLDKTLLDS